MAQRKYSNILLRIFHSFYAKEYYRFVAYEQKRSGFYILAMILFVTYLMPSLLIGKGLSGFSFATTQNAEIIEIRDEVAELPNLKIRERKLTKEHNAGLPLSIKIGSIDKNFLVVDDTQNSLITANTVMLFGQDGVYYNNLELVAIMLKIFEFGNIPLQNISSNTNFTEYPEDEVEFDGKQLNEWGEQYINFLGQNLLFSIFPLAFLASLLFKIIEIFVLSLLTSVFVARYGLRISYKQLYKLTIAATIPSLIIKMLDASTLWSSKILGSPSFGFIFILGLNIYFIHFAVSSLVPVVRKQRGH